LAARFDQPAKRLAKRDSTLTKRLGSEQYAAAGGQALPAVVRAWRNW
jgi:hypothetical protein